MDRRLRNRILVFLVLAGAAAYGLIRLSQRQPVAKISAVNPIREDLVSSISSNGKVEPITPYVVRAQLDTFVESVRAVEGQQVKKGELLLELDVKDAQARLAEARAALLRAQDDWRAAADGLTKQRRRMVPWQRRLLIATGCGKNTTHWSGWWRGKRPHRMSWPRTNWP